MKKLQRRRKTSLFARETSPRRVDHSVKRQNVKKRSVKKVKQPKALASSDSSESEGTGETRRRNEMVDETEEDSATKEGTESKKKSTTAGTKGEYSYSEDTYFDVDDDDVGNVEINHDNIIEVGNTQQGSSQKKSGQTTNVGGINPLSITTDFRLLHIQEQLQTTHVRDCLSHPTPVGPTYDSWTPTTTRTSLKPNGPKQSTKNNHATGV
ncbi:hypothetical protein Dimus_022089 [Dionaea muscipula]